MKIRARVAAAAHGASARGIERSGVVREAGVSEVETPLAREGGPRATRARGQDAVEHVDAAGHATDERGRAPHPHEVAGPVARHVLRDKRLEALEHGLVVLPHRVSPDAVAGKTAHLLELPERPQSEVEVHPTLYDAEESLIGPRVGGTAPFRPPAREVDRPLDLRARSWIAHALVELHDDVRPELLGDVHVRLGSPGEPATVVVDRAKHDPVVRELHELLVAEDLEAAGVGEDRPVPLHELMKSAELADDVDAGTHGEVIGVGEHDMCPNLLERLREDALDRPLRAHGHEDRRGHVAMGGVEDARARMGGRILCDDVIGEPAIVLLVVASVLLAHGRLLWSSRNQSMVHDDRRRVRTSHSNSGEAPTVDIDCRRSAGEKDELWRNERDGRALRRLAVSPLRWNR